MKQVSKGDITKIAVTGGAASGKSTVCNYLEEKKIPVIRLDDVAREVVMPGMPAYDRIVAHLGQGVVCKDGTLNRPELRRMMTGNPERKQQLESWIQPAILTVMHRRITEWEDKGRAIVAVEIPLLFELNMEKDFDVSVLVAVDPDVQIRRLMERDNITEDSARSLIDIQMPLEEKVKRADIIVYNNETPEKLWDAVSRALGSYLEKMGNMSKALDR